MLAQFCFLAFFALRLKLVQQAMQYDGNGNLQFTVSSAFVLTISINISSVKGPAYMTADPLSPKK